MNELCRKALQFQPIERCRKSIVDAWCLRRGTIGPSPDAGCAMFLRGCRSLPEASSRTRTEKPKSR